ncbi:MAG TPA: hypothetical protein VM681_02395 [Candidatus Thermoplasmatota archaeon]|nr:hypothetical protein [Candidatus Thermoplasmatota archaeon]
MGRATSAAGRLALALAALSLFVLAILLLKNGASSIQPFVRGFLQVDGPVSALGFGWLLSYVALSGSPVAATAIGLLGGGLLTNIEAFFMIGGSRFGAAMVVLLIGFIYQLRGHARHTSLMTGVLALMVTITIYLPALALGYFVFSSGALDGIQVGTPPQVADVIDLTFGRVADAALQALGGVPTFLLGLATVAGALSLFDRAVPDFDPRSGRVPRMAGRIYRPSVMFAFGMAVTALTLSVSVSISLLVPLSAKGYVRRENLIPYIMGANITTFIDTLLAAIVAGAGFTVVLAEMAAVFVVSLVVIGLFYTPYEERLMSLTNTIVSSTRSLLVFLVVLVLCPLLLLVL